MIVDLKALSAIDFIKFNLKKIEIAKDMFVKEIEHGEEVFIPSEMTQDSYPVSMRYYDPILVYLQNHMSFDQKEILYTKADIIIKY